jgi:hypothetical protein
MHNNPTMASYNTNSAAISSTKIDQTSARDAVFSTYELLEAVLLDIPAEDILFAAKVNKRWHSVIATSPSIHKYLQKTLNVFRPLGKRNQASNGIYVG